MWGLAVKTCIDGIQLRLGALSQSPLFRRNKGIEYMLGTENVAKSRARA